MTGTGCSMLDSAILVSMMPAIYVSHTLHRSPTIPLASDAEMVEAVLAMLPLGTSLDQAEAVMQDRGFQCTRETMAWDDLPAPYLECKGYYKSEHPLVATVVYISISHDDAGVVTGVRVRQFVDCL